MMHLQQYLLSLEAYRCALTDNKKWSWFAFKIPKVAGVMMAIRITNYEMLALDSFQAETDQ